MTSAFVSAEKDDFLFLGLISMPMFEAHRNMMNRMKEGIEDSIAHIGIPRSGVES